MNFRPRRPEEEPEINFIPLIDLLLVILIFLMITTTYNRLTGIQIQLPEANAHQNNSLKTQDILLVIKPDSWQIDHDIYSSSDDLLQALISKAKTKDDGWLILYADADAKYQQVIDTMALAQQAGLTQITMATQTKTE